MFLGIRLPQHTLGYPQQYAQQQPAAQLPVHPPIQPPAPQFGVAAQQPQQPKRRWPLWIIAIAAIVACALVASATWLALRRDSLTSSVSELRAAVAAAQDGVEAAENQAESYKNELARTGKTDTAKRLVKIESQVADIEQSIKKADDVLVYFDPDTNELQANDSGVTADDVKTQLEEITVELVDTTAVLKETTEETKKETAALQELPEVKKMDIDAISRGDYSSIQGTWRHPGDDGKYNYVVITGNTIQAFGNDGTKYDTIEGLGYKYTKDPGSDREEEMVIQPSDTANGNGKVEMTWSPRHSDNFSHATMFGFYQAGATIKNPTKDGEVSSNIDADRILYAPNISGRFGARDMENEVLERVADAE